MKIARVVIEIPVDVENEDNISEYMDCYVRNQLEENRLEEVANIHIVNETLTETEVVEACEIARGAIRWIAMFGNIGNQHVYDTFDNMDLSDEYLATLLKRLENFLE